MTAADICRDLKWNVGQLFGQSSHGMTRVFRLTAIGESSVMVRYVAAYIHPSKECKGHVIVKDEKEEICNSLNGMTAIDRLPWEVPNA